MRRRVWICRALRDPAHGYLRGIPILASSLVIFPTHFFLDADRVLPILTTSSPGLRPIIRAQASPSAHNPERSCSKCCTTSLTSNLLRPAPPALTWVAAASRSTLVVAESVSFPRAAFRALRWSASARPNCSGLPPEPQAAAGLNTLSAGVVEAAAGRRILFKRRIPDSGANTNSALTRRRQQEVELPFRSFNAAVGVTMFNPI